MKTCRTILLLVAAVVMSAAQTSAQPYSHELIDLGIDGDFVEVTDLNDHGQVIGSAWDDTGGWSYIWTHGQGATDIGNLGGGFVMPQKINNDGTVAGVAMNAQGHEVAFTWDASSAMAAIPMLPGVVESSVHDLNEVGQVVGTMEFDTGATHGYLWSASDGLTDLGQNVTPNALNNLGEVVGHAPFPQGTHAFHWSSGTGMTDLGTVDDFGDSKAHDISDTGYIVGESDAEPSNPETNAFVYHNGDMDEINPFDYDDVRLFAVNDSGMAAGISDADTSYTSIMIVMANGQKIEVDSGIQRHTYMVHDVTDSGYVLGYSRPWDNIVNEAPPFIWDPVHGKRAITDLFDTALLGIPEGVTEEDWQQMGGWGDEPGPRYPFAVPEVWGINEAGQIIGTYFNADGQRSVFLLTEPLDDPASPIPAPLAVVVGVGLIGWIGIKRRA